MKQLIILTAILFASVSSAMAQISKTQADEIVSERLEKETQAYTFFDRDTIHTEFEVLTANGEILKLNYRCWIYYILYTSSNAGLYMIINESNGNLLEVRTSNAKPEDIEQNNENDTLQVTKWKLIGIVDVQTSDLTELEPKDCEKCYTLTFDTDSTFLTFSSTNELQGLYKVDYLSQTIQIADFGGTKINEIGNGNLYVKPFWEMTIQSFSIQKNELKLFYNENKNYLLFKSLEL